MGEKGQTNGQNDEKVRGWVIMDKTPTTGRTRTERQIEWNGQEDQAGQEQEIKASRSTRRASRAV